MTTDNDSQSVEGEIVGPETDGQWQSATTAHVALGIGSKTLYRRIGRHQIPSRTNPLGRLEVWVPTVTESPGATQALAPISGVSVDDGLVLAIIQEMKAQREQDRERLTVLTSEVTRQAEEIGNLKARLAAATQPRWWQWRPWKP